MPISSRDQIIPAFDNEMDKSDRLACIRYKKSKCFGLRLQWRRENSRVTQNLKVTDFIKLHYEQNKVL